MGGSYCTLMLAVKALTHTLMLSEREASALQEEFVPWHKERCDFQSAHIHLTHPDSRPWSRVMSSPSPPVPPPAPEQPSVPTWLEWAPFKQRVTLPRYCQGTEGELRADTPGKANNDPREHFLFSPSREEAFVILTKQKKSLGRTHPTCSQLNVGQVMSWLYTQPCHMTGPHREGHSTHDSSAVKCAVGLQSSTCWSRHWCQTGAVCGCVLLSHAGDEQLPSCCWANWIISSRWPFSFSAGLRRALQICLWIKVILLYQPEKQWRRRSRENCAIV